MSDYWEIGTHKLIFTYWSKNPKNGGCSYSLNIINYYMWD